jgi:hypothetical protein
MVVQRGIDIHFARANGKSFYADGGINGGRKPLVLYAAHMIRRQNPDLAAEMIAGTASSYQEDTIIYQGRNEALWGRAGTSAQYADCVASPYDGCSNKTVRDPNGLVDGGRCAHGPACSGDGPQPSPANQRSSGRYAMAPYQTYTPQYFAGAALARILGLEDEWNYQPFFDYTDRIAGPPWNYYCLSHCDGQAYIEEMHKTYGCSSAACGEARAAANGASGVVDLPRPYLR